MTVPRENAPKITIVFGIESNAAFFVACFVLICAMGWAVRDHRRRQLQLTTAEQEDHLYLAVLTIFFIICTMGAYFAFRRTTTQRLLDAYGEPLDAEIEEEILEKLLQYMPKETKDSDDADLFNLAMTTILTITFSAGGYFMLQRIAGGLLSPVSLTAKDPRPLMFPTAYATARSPTPARSVGRSVRSSRSAASSMASNTSKASFTNLQRTRSSVNKSTSSRKSQQKSRKDQSQSQGQSQGQSWHASSY